MDDWGTALLVLAVVLILNVVQALDRRAGRHRWEE
jgi:hypothetical protein